MGRFSRIAGIATVATLMASAPAAAQDAGLDCFEGQYTDEQRSQVLALGSEMNGGMQVVQSVLGQIAQVIGPAIGACAASESWSAEQTQFATVYEMGRQSEAALRAAGTMTADELARFDAALADPANSEVMPAVGRVVRSSMGGSTAVDPGDAALMGEFVTNAGLDIGAAGTTTGELAGLLLAFIGLQQIGETEYTALTQ